MNPTDLRDELAARAGETDRHNHPDLLPGVHHKIRATKRRRIATALAAAATIAALAIAITPSLVTTTQPDPATPTPNPSPPPTDEISGDITLPGTLDGRPLLASRIGTAGQTTVSFYWTPDKPPITITTVCSARVGTVLQASIEGVGIGRTDCAPGSSAPQVTAILLPTAAVWSSLSAGVPAKVELRLLDPDGRPVSDDAAILAAGIYPAPPSASRTAMPSQQPPTSSDDYVHEGIRYRAKIAGDRLTAARVADRGSRELSLEFTPDTARISLRTFCLGDDRHRVEVTLNSRPMTTELCRDAGTDAGAVGGFSGLPGRGLHDVLVGRANVLRLRLVDTDGKPVQAPNGLIGIGVYRLGAQRIISPGEAGLPELKEYAGRLYRLAGVRTTPATRGSIRVATPGGVPFLIAYGSTDTGPAMIRVQLDGIDDAAGLSGPAGVGQTEAAQPTRAAGEATLRIVEGKAVKGLLYAGIYVPR